MLEPGGEVVEPALFPHAAVAVVLQALVDNLAHTVVFVVEAREPATGRLTALWSSAPVSLGGEDATLREAAQVWRKTLWDNSGPFA